MQLNAWFDVLFSVIKKSSRQKLYRVS